MGKRSGRWTISFVCKTIGTAMLLRGCSLKSVLQRGYSITTNKKTALLIRNLEDVRIGELLITELAGENLIESKVTNKQNRGK